MGDPRKTVNEKILGKRGESGRCGTTDDSLSVIIGWFIGVNSGGVVLGLREARFHEPR